MNQSRRLVLGFAVARETRSVCDHEMCHQDRRQIKLTS